MVGSIKVTSSPLFVSSGRCALRYSGNVFPSAAAAVSSCAFSSWGMRTCILALIFHQIGL